MAAWLRHAIESAGYHEHLAGGCDGHPEHLAQFYNAVYGDTGHSHRRQLQRQPSRRLISDCVEDM